MSNRSEQPGPTTSEAEVTNISRHGFWLYLAGRELFVSFANFPWFADAPVGKITQVEWPAKDHLYWPALDIDLSVPVDRASRRFSAEIGDAQLGAAPDVNRSLNLASATSALRFTPVSVVRWADPTAARQNDC